MFSQAPAIGIDLGTCYSCCAVYMNDRIEIILNDEGNRRTPSYVAFAEMNRLIGSSAGCQAARNPLNTVYDAKRLIGRKYTEPTVQNDIKLWPFKVEAGLDDKPMIVVNYKGETKKFHPEEISAMVLTKMKATAEAYLGKPATKAVITVPAYFNDSQRQATKDAGAIAGLNVLRIISESTAAAIAYGFGKYQEQEEHDLVFDLGGGTMNVSLLALEDGVYEVKAVAGNTHLGGEDFDNKLVEYCCAEFLKKEGIDIRGNPRALRRLRTHCEEAKRILSSANQTIIEIDGLGENIDFICTITRAKFEELCMSMFKECIPPIDKVLKDSCISKNQIHEVVLVGGSTRIPKVQELLRDYFNGKELNKSINPEEAVAYGAAIQAAVLTGQDNEQIRDVLLLDVTPFSLGIETGDGVRTVLIPGNTTLPTKKLQTFSTSSENQTSITFQVYEGEGHITENCHKLGEFNLDGIAPAPKGVPQIEVSIEICENGIIIVNAEDKTSNKSSKITITNERGRLSKDDIEKAVVEENKRKAEELFLNQKAQVKQNLCQMIQTAQIQLKELQYLLQQEENWMDSHPNAKIEQYEQKFKSLEEIIDPIFTSFRLKQQRN